MKIKILGVLVFFLFSPVVLGVFTSDTEKTIASEKLRALRDIHVYNTIFHNYHTGGSSPFDEGKEITNEN